MLPSAPAWYRRNEGQPGAGVAADPGGLAAMQLGVDRYGDRADPKDAIEAFEIWRAIGREQADAVAGLDIILARQRGADRRGTPRKGGVVGIEIEAGEQRRRIGAQARGLL